jgi:hypothetical protein
VLAGCAQAEDMFFQPRRTTFPCLRPYKRSVTVRSGSPFSTTVRSFAMYEVNELALIV